MDQSSPASGRGAVVVSQSATHTTAVPQTFTTAFTVGRSESCDVVVSDQRVSRRHLVVRPTADGWRAQCAEGRSMLVNGRAQTSATLTGTSRIQLIDEDGPLLVMTLGPVSAPGPGPDPGAAPGAVPATATVPSPVTAPGPTTDPAAPDMPRSVTISRIGTIGRAPDNDFVLTDPLVSAHHARIEWSARGVLITDLGSTNGTFVGNTRINSYLVTEPTTVGIGSNFIVVSPADGGRVQETTTAGELVARDLTFSVSVKHGRLTLLDGISFALPGNELLAVVGPSGAGKSTLLKALTGEQKAQKGQVLFDGLDVYSHYAVMRNRIGVVPQNDVVHADLTVRQTLQYAAELRFAKDVSKKERNERIAEVLEDLDLTEHVSKRVKKLSGGQRKRVSTAIELLTKPGLLFLDEPTSGLDPQLDRDVMDLLASLAHGTRPGDTGRTVMVVTHNENHIDRADKVLILAAGGKPVYFGPPRDVIGYFEQRLADIYQGGRLITQAPSGGFADPTEITGFADVYALIRNHTPELRTRLEATVPSTRPGGARPSSDKSNRTPPKAPSQTALRQVSMLVRRHLRIIAADPSYLVFMLVLPIIMGLLTKAISGDFGFTVPDLDLTALTPAEVQNKHTNQALQLLVVLITGAAFAGMSVTIRELVGERDVFLREKAVGLRPGAYLTAKTIVLALVATVQTALMMGVAFAINKPPTDALVLKSAPLELSMCCWLTAFACGLMGLMVSAFVSSSAQVMPVLVVAIMGQIVMAGGLIDISGKVVFEQLAWFMPSRWGYAMAASTLDMNRIVTYRTDDLWEHTAHQWLIDFGCLSALALTCLLACLIGLVRRGRR
ncbi:ATP-binding cassette domain-containing protein [uncultured Actinomyces sp.]|uniref:ATP-binding cassette domain-containing protein n=2 Tax=uncultured Actinomyces sp. TaxID=249061 RepID=UPI0028DC2704|nr:ATP-binding cassette domain-containing protein [uncultured Actinomyces sp.]